MNKELIKVRLRPIRLGQAKQEKIIALYRGGAIVLVWIDKNVLPGCRYHARTCGTIPSRHSSFDCCRTAEQSEFILKNE